VEFKASLFITSAILIAVLFTARYFLIRAVRRKSKSGILSKDQRRWLSRIRNSTIFLLLFGLIMIWAPQLQALALSLTAVAVALVIATKEMILCVTGAFMRVTTRPFKVGDWITIEGFSGEVTDVNAFTFILQEVDVAGGTYQFTGRTIDVPNGKLFTSSVENLNFMKRYVYLDVPFTVQYGDIDPAILLPKVEKLAERHYAPLRAESAAYNARIEKTAGTDFADPDPRIFFHQTDAGHSVYNVRLFVPTAQAAELTRIMGREIQELVHREKTASALSGEK
jgi:small-conductance mechanosensitive channel